MFVFFLTYLSYLYLLYLASESQIWSFSINFTDSICYFSPELLPKCLGLTFLCPWSLVFLMINLNWLRCNEKGSQLSRSDCDSCRFILFVHAIFFFSVQSLCYVRFSGLDFLTLEHKVSSLEEWVLSPWVWVERQRQTDLQNNWGSYLYLNFHLLELSDFNSKALV